MNDSLNLYTQIYLMPIGVRALIWIGILLFIISLILSPFLMKILAAIIRLFRIFIQFIYIIICWIFVAPFQKYIGGLFTRINDTIVSFFEICDRQLGCIIERCKKTKISITKPSLLIYALLIILISSPDILTLNNDAKLRIFQNSYVKTETYIFGEPIIPVSGIIEQNENKENPTDIIDNTTVKEEIKEPIVVKVAYIKKDSALNLRTEPNANSESIFKFYLGDELYYIGETVENNGEEWSRVMNFDNLEGWVRRQYLEGIPTE